MAAGIRMGTILIEESAILPDALLSRSERICSDWIVARNLDRYKLEQRVRHRGGAFVSLRPELRAAVCGYDLDKTVRKALQQVMLNAQSATFNCLEITTVDAIRILGLVYVRVSAHAWHIIESVVAAERAVIAESELPAA